MCTYEFIESMLKYLFNDSIDILRRYQLNTYECQIIHLSCNIQLHSN